MARRKNKPAEEKAEPTIEKVATIEQIEEDKALAQSFEQGSVTFIDTKEATEEVKEVEEAKEEQPELTPIEPTIYASQEAEKEESKNDFPKVEVCLHPKTKRKLDRRSRVTHVCTNPQCNQIVKTGGR